MYSNAFKCQSTYNLNLHHFRLEQHREKHTGPIDIEKGLLKLNVDTDLNEVVTARVFEDATEVIRKLQGTTAEVIVLHMYVVDRAVVHLPGAR